MDGWIARVELDTLRGLVDVKGPTLSLQLFHDKWNVSTCNTDIFLGIVFLEAVQGSIFFAKI